MLKYKKAKVELLIFDIGYNLRKYIHKKKKKREDIKLHKLTKN